MTPDEENQPRTKAIHCHRSKKNLGYHQDYEPGANFERGATRPFVWVRGSGYSCA